MRFGKYWHGQWYKVHAFHPHDLLKGLETDFLRLPSFDEDRLYMNSDWIAEQQKNIEKSFMKVVVEKNLATYFYMMLRNYSQEWFETTDFTDEHG